MNHADIANDLVEWRLEQALKARQQLSTAVSREDCARCDEPIPEARQKALPGVQLCVGCQTMLEGR